MRHLTVLLLCSVCLLLNSDRINAPDRHDRKADRCVQFKMIVVVPPENTSFKSMVVKPAIEIDKAMVVNPCTGSPQLSSQTMPGIIMPDDKNGPLRPAPRSGSRRMRGGTQSNTR
jgi:hypothetical protein